MNVILKRKYLLFLLLFIQVIVIKIISLFPYVIMLYYVDIIYPWISSMQRSILIVLGINLGDLLYLLLGLLLMYSIVRLSIKRFKNWKLFLSYFLIFLNIFYFTFHVFWGFNYYKEPFLEQFHIEKQKGTDQDLFEMTEFMIQKTNDLREKTTEDKEGVFKNKESFEETTQKVKKGYNSLCKELKIHNFKEKPLFVSWYSELISHLGIGGYYNPFVGSAQINGTILPVDYGMTVGHEIAHQYGFASEKEANYVSFLNGSKSEDIDLQYSVYYNTIWRLLYEVYKIDFDRFEYYKTLLSKKVKRDRLADKAYYEKYQGKINDAFSRANNLYLRANGQEGIESYSYYVQLVLNQYLIDKTNN